MTFSKQFLLACAIWCLLDQVHLLPSNVKGSSQRQPLIAKASFEGDPNECGKSKKIIADKLAIVGGDEAMIGDWPWMVALFLGSPLKPSSHLYWCGGSLISKQWVVTAAHCVAGINETKSYVRLGDLDLDDRVNDGASPIDVRIVEIVPHPEYNDHPSTNDIALIRLKTPVYFTENISPVCLLSGEEYKTSTYYNGKHAFITGWGNVGHEQEDSTRLLETSISMVPEEKCAEQYSNMTEVFLIDERVICAADPGKDTCQGDSGGPLVFHNTVDKRFYLGGITSGGNECASPNYSGVYTKVAQFTNWITEVTGNNF